MSKGGISRQNQIEHYRWLTLNAMQTMRYASRLIPLSGFIFAAVVALSVSAVSAVAADAHNTNQPAGAYHYSVPPQTGDGWDTADLTSAAVNSSLIGELFDQIRDGSYQNIHAVLLVKNDKLIIEEYFAGTNSGGKRQTFNRDTLHSAQSVTKSVNSLLLGIALDRHLIGSVDDKISKYLPTYSGVFTNADKDSIRVKHLLSMTAGLSWNELSVPYSDPANDLIRMYTQGGDFFRCVLEKPVVATPGTKFVYNSGASILLGEILRQASGMPADQFAERYLFTPLGISKYSWLKHTNGIVNTARGLALRPRDMAKIGSLCLNHGRWRGEQIVSDKWLMKSLKPQYVGIPLPGGISGYGFQWWLGAFRVHDRVIQYVSARGSGGQYIFIFPGLQTVAVFTAWNLEAEDQPLDMLYHYILPALLPVGKVGPAQARRQLIIAGMFGDRTDELALPKVTAASTVSASEALDKARAALGGEAAAGRIHSFHAKGTVDLDHWLFAPSSFEWFAKRPGVYRAVTDMKSPDGGNAGVFTEGFDGTNGWNAAPDAAPQLLQSRELQERIEHAAFLAWYDDPQRYQSAEMLGETLCANRRCYALKVVTKSGNEMFRYYNATNFLPVAAITTIKSKNGPAWIRIDYGDYQTFGGMKFPMLIATRLPSAGRVLRYMFIDYTAIEINRVEDAAVRMPSPSVLSQEKN